jgi:hypothetical protein
MDDHPSGPYRLHHRHLPVKVKGNCGKIFIDPPTKARSWRAFSCLIESRMSPRRVTQ